MVTHFSIPLLVVGSLAVFGTSSHDSKLMQGTWTPVKFIFGGSPIPAATLAQMKLKMTADQFEFVAGPSHDFGKIALRADKTPKEMDIIGVKGPNAGKTYPAIYRLEAGKLTICYGIDGKRPKEFSSPKQSMILLVVYTRRAPAKS